jgi:hypothetical protein
VFALVGIGAFVACRLVWPLAPASVSWGLLLLALFGYVVDLRLRKVRPDGTPQLVWVAALLVWGALGLALQEPAALGGQMRQIVAPLAAYFLVAHAVQSFRALQAMGGVLVGVTIFLSVASVAQGTAPLGCYQTEGERFVWDGRLCNTHVDCERDPGAEPGVDYGCEHVGWFGTQSMGGRVRWSGSLADPSALAVCIAAGLPFALAFYDRRRWWLRALFALAVLTLGIAAELFARSRTGQLGLLAALLIYLGRRYRWGGVALTGVLAIVFLVFGGREWSESTAATELRLQGLREGLAGIAASPIFGDGMGRWAEHHVVRAPSSLLQVGAELGLPGLLLWGIVLYLSIRIPPTALRRIERLHGPEASVARTWALALTASWAAMAVGVLFLPLAFDVMPWTWMGLSGALLTSLRSHDPEA